MRRSPARSVLCLWLATSIVVGSCGAPARPTPPKPAPSGPLTTAIAAPTARPTVAVSTGEAAEMTLAFSAGRTATTASTVGPLGDAETAALIARMEPLPKLDNANAPTLRAPSLPPPRSGPVQPIAFVMPTGKAVGDAPLAAKTTVVDPMTAPTILPSGDVDAEAEVRIRFPDAMIPIAKIGDVGAPPARMTPTAPGTWRWIDTRVLGFFATKRLAQATTYTVTVPAGTRALSGATLANETVGTFSTKAIALAGVFPSQLRSDSAIAVAFDAAFDPATLLPFLRVQTTKGAKRVPFHVIDRATADAAWKKLPQLVVADKDLGTHYVLIAPDTAWPQGVELQVMLATGAPSSEGPRVAAKPSYAGATVVPAFTARGMDCEGTPRFNVRCSANNAFQLSFTNPIDQKAFRADKIQIAGEEFEDRYVYDDAVSLSAPVKEGRRYEIVIGDGLLDVYGQPYVGPKRLPFTTSRHEYYPYLSAQTGFHVIDPRFQIPQWVLVTQAVASVRVELYKVTPADYFAFEQLEETRDDGSTRAKAAPIPGTRIYDKTHVIGPRHGADIRVDLRPALGRNETGHVIAIATVVPAGTRGIDRWFARRNLAWIQVTKLGVTARYDGEKLSAWTREIAPARFLAPIAGTKMSVIREGDHGTAIATGLGDASGHVSLELPAPRRSKTNAIVAARSIVVAEANGDSTFVAFGTDRSERRQTARWYVTDDRFTYRPGEKVYAKGWVRLSHTGVNPDITAPPAGETVSWSLHDSRRNQLATGTARLSDQGGFDLEASLPDTANLGTATFSFTTRGTSTSHSISIQEFRTPAYSVALADDTQFSGSRPLIVGESIEMRAEAKYFAGGGLPGADIRWSATLTPSTFVPPNWSLFAFDPAGDRSLRVRRWYRHNTTAGTRIEVADVATLGGDSSSTATLGISQTPAHRPALLEVDTTVADLDRMQIRASSRTIVVHPSSYYVGLRLRPNDPDHNTIEAIVTDIDGTPVAGVPVAIEIEGVLGSERYRDDAKVVETQHCKVTSGSAPVACPFDRKAVALAYTATARIADARGRTNSAEYMVPWWSRDDARDLKLSPDKPSYRPGEVAKIEILSKTVPASAVVTIARNGVVREQSIELTKPSTIIEVPIEPAYIANVFVIVDRWSALAKTRGGSTLPLPDHTQDQVELSVDMESARLEMTTTPDKALVEPGAMAAFEATVKHDGKPVANAEVALMVIDEAILSLSYRKHEDPLAEFYQQYPAGAHHIETLGLVRDQGPELAGSPGFTRYSLDTRSGLGMGTGSGSGFGSGHGGMSGRSGSVSSVVEARKDFRPVAVFSPLLRTDANGKVRVEVKMPDNLTRYRIIAIATANTRWFGKAENTIVAQRMINARTVAPRFLTQGDRFSLPILVQNLASTPRTVDIAVRAGNLTATGPQGKRVSLGAGERAEVRFDFATIARGKAVIQTILVAGDQTDASNVTLPVWEPATTETFATYGVVDDKAGFEQLAVPSNVFTDVGGVELEVSSTQLQSLTDAYWYLQAYPYECAEQRSGRMLATSAMYDVLDAFATPGRPTRTELGAQRDRDVRKLVDDQLANGGWGYFPGMEADPFVTAQVLTSLGRANDASARARTKATAYVTKFVDGELGKLVKATTLPGGNKGERMYRVSIVAAGLAALASAGADVRARVERLHSLATTLGTYPMDAKARVLALVATGDRTKATRAKLLADVLSATHETASSASVTSQFTEAERMLLVSNTKTTALALDALIRVAPDNALIPKLARGVLDARASGRWRTTQDNLVVLTAMRHYFDTYEKVEPNFRSKLWLGKAAYAESAFIGRSGARGFARAGWSELAPGTTHDLALVKDGPGRMYYRVGITYAPKETALPPLDAGFVVRRSYTALDDPRDVTELPDGRWRVKLGARVLVTVQASTTARRHAVAVTDPLPAGFEPVNTQLATAERAAATTGDFRWSFRAMRDNRAEAFAMAVAEGTHQFSYTARATTPGTFVAAPAKAEEMYSPETFGRSGGVTVVIE